MILPFFRNWVEHKSTKLNSLNISSEILNREFINDKRVQDPSLGVIHESLHCLGQILVWESQQFEMEVVHIDTEKVMYWKYLEKIDTRSDLDEITSDYFQVLHTGMKL
ncbi:immunity protein TriTu family protein [Brevibacillus reuszeri]|uniref:immunity protein TriTu family protein n=1 Tax=Brevibacillus reuszeri TaxID=54915 RepID=UPI00406A5877